MSDATMDLPPVRAASLVQAVHAELKRRILDGQLEPGEDVPDSVVAKQLGVSRAPVRDACNLLVQSGLLTKQQNFPYRVREYSEKDVTELQLIRWGYESAAVRHLTRSGIRPSGTDGPLTEMREAAASRDGQASGQADLEFHIALVRSTTLLELTKRHASVMDQMSVAMRSIPLFAVPTQEHRHREILDVLEESQRVKDPGPILRLMSTHLLTSRDDVSESDQLRPKH